MKIENPSYSFSNSYAVCDYDGDHQYFIRINENHSLENKSGTFEKSPLKKIVKN
jgi:hypothetical protein